MLLMRLLHLFQVDVRGFVADRITLVDQTVVNDEINRAVQRDAETDGQGERGRTKDADVNQIDRKRSETEAENVVQFERRVNGSIVMRLMNEPEGTVKEILVNKPGEDFHAEYRQDERGEHRCVYLKVTKIKFEPNDKNELIKSSSHYEIIV